MIILAILLILVAVFWGMNFVANMEPNDGEWHFDASTAVICIGVPILFAVAI